MSKRGYTFGMIGAARWISLASLGLVLALSGCGGGDPASPPGPPAELPSALIFPDDVGINVDKVRSESEGEDSDEDSDGDVSTLVPAQGPLSTAIATGAQMSDMLNDTLEDHLGLFNEMEVEVSEAVDTFTGTFTIQLPMAFGGTSFDVEVKIDFADFDYDDDGADEGCSGHTGATPICFRFWVNGNRFMAGVFDEFPTEDNAGAGRFTVAISEDPTEIAGGDFLMKAIYDHSDPEDKSSELLGQGSSEAMGDEEMSGEEFAGHAIITQEGPDETAIKSLNAASAQISSGEPPFDMQYLGAWKEDGDYWSGSVDLEFEEIQVTDACAQISTATEVASSFCEDLGIDVSDVEFVDVPASGELALPDDFPEDPTF